MRRPRTVNGYSIKDIFDNYRYVDIADGPFWDAAYKFFGQDQMAEMRHINMDVHAQRVWEAKAYCEEHGGFWGEEDEDEEFMAAMYDFAGTRPSRMAGMFLHPLSDDEYDRQNNPNRNQRDPWENDRDGDNDGPEGFGWGGL